MNCNKCITLVHDINIKVVRGNMRTLYFLINFLTLLYKIKSTNSKNK